MGGINDDHINACSGQSFNPCSCFRASTDGSTNQQATLVVFGGVGVGFGLLDVFDGHHASEVERIIDDQLFLDAMAVQQFANLNGADAFLNSDQFFFWRHDIADQRIHARFKADITGGNDTDQIAIGENRHTGDVVLMGQLNQVTDGGAGVDGDRILDHTGLKLFDLAHFESLLLDGHVFVNNAHATFLRHGNRQTGFGNGVHGSGQQWDIQLNTPGKPGFEADVFRQYLGISGHQ